MKVGIMGSGNIGENLRKHWTKARHSITFSSRYLNELDSLTKEAGKNSMVISTLIYIII